MLSCQGTEPAAELKYNFRYSRCFFAAVLSRLEPTTHSSLNEVHSVCIILDLLDMQIGKEWPGLLAFNSHDEVDKAWTHNGGGNDEAALYHFVGFALGPRRFTNVFDESKINRIRIFAMLWTEYNDSLVRTKYPSDSRSTQRSNPVIYVKLRHRTIHLLFSIAFAVALTFIMLFIFNLILRPSLFIRFLPSATAPFPNA